MSDPTCPGSNPLEFLRGVWHFLLFALFGGISNYAARVKSGTIHGWSLYELSGDLLISGFVGTLSILLCREFGMSDYITGATVGMAGHLGSRAVFIAEKVLRARFGRAIDGP